MACNSRFKQIIELDTDYFKALSDSDIIPKEAKPILKNLARYGFYLYNKYFDKNYLFDKYFNKETGIVLQRVKYEIKHCGSLKYIHKKIVTTVNINNDPLFDTAYIKISDNTYVYSDNDEFSMNFDNTNNELVTKVEGAMIRDNNLIYNLIKLKEIYNRYFNKEDDFNK